MKQAGISMVSLLLAMTIAAAVLVSSSRILSVYEHHFVSLDQQLDKQGVLSEAQLMLNYALTHAMVPKPLSANEVPASFISATQAIKIIPAAKAPHAWHLQGQGAGKISPQSSILLVERIDNKRVYLTHPLPRHTEKICLASNPDFKAKQAEVLSDALHLEIVQISRLEKTLNGVCLVLRRPLSLSFVHGAWLARFIWQAFYVGVRKTRNTHEPSLALYLIDHLQQRQELLPGIDQLVIKPLYLKGKLKALSIKIGAGKRKHYLLETL